MSNRQIRSYLMLTLLLLAVLPAAWAQEEDISLGELARRERERKRNAAKPARVLTLEDLTMDCGSDWDCLLAAVNLKAEARLKFTETLDLTSSNGTIRASDIHVELREFTEATVVMKAWQENSRLRYSDQTQAMALARGVEAAELAAQEREAERQLQRRDGHLITCVFQHERMKEFIRLTKISRENDGAWRLAERCDGLDEPILIPRSTSTVEPETVPETR